MTNKVVINELIYFELEDVELRKLFEFLNAVGCSLRMDCYKCGTTILPQVRRHFAETGEEEFKVNCVNCGNVATVRMYRDYGFILPTDDEFYAGRPSEDGWK